MRSPQARKAAARSRRQAFGQTEQSIYDGREWLGTITRLSRGFLATDAMGRAVGAYPTATKAVAEILKIRRGSLAEEDAL
jgi:hypothetical protein